MSDDGPEWFAPKRYGYGANLPISWQGWAITIAFCAAVGFAAFLLKDRPLQLIGALAPLVVAFLVISAKTTRGGWHWRWGDKD